MRKLIDDAYQRTHQILTEHIDKLKLIATELLKRENLDAEEFAALFEGEEFTTPLAGSSSSGGASRETSSSSPDSDTPPNVVPPSTAPLPA